MVAGACNSSNFGGWGGRLTWTREIVPLHSNLGDGARLHLKKQENKTKQNKNQLLHTFLHSAMVFYLLSVYFMTSNLRNYFLILRRMTKDLTKENRSSFLVPKVQGRWNEWGMNRWRAMESMSLEAWLTSLFMWKGMEQNPIASQRQKLGRKGLEVVANDPETSWLCKEVLYV